MGDKIKATSIENSDFSSEGRKKVVITKSNDDERLVFGWASVAKDEDGNYPLDHDGHIFEPEVLEKAAYDFVVDYRATGERHMGDSIGTMVESIMFTKEKMQVLGIPDGTLPEGWWVGFRIDDVEVFQKIKSGEYGMFSIQGTGNTKPITKEERDEQDTKDSEEPSDKDES